MSHLLHSLQERMSPYPDMRELLDSPDLQEHCDACWQEYADATELSGQRAFAIALLHLIHLVRESTIPEGWEERLVTLFSHIGWLWDIIAEAFLPFLRDLPGPASGRLLKAAQEECWWLATKHIHYTKKMLSLLPNECKAYLDTWLLPLLDADDQREALVALLEEKGTWGSLLLWCEKLLYDRELDDKRLALLRADLALRKERDALEQYGLFDRAICSLVEGLNEEEYEALFVQAGRVPPFVFERMATPALAQQAWLGAEKTQHYPTKYPVKTEADKRVLFDGLIRVFRQFTTLGGRDYGRDFMIAHHSFGFHHVLAQLDVLQDDSDRLLLHGLMGGDRLYGGLEYPYLPEEVIAHFASFSETVQVRVARLLAFWGLVRRDTSVIDTLLLETWSDETRYALEAARERALPDWKDLITRGPGLVSGEDSFANPVRQREWQEFLQRMQEDDAHLRDRIPESMAFYRYEPMLFVFNYLFLFPTCSGSGWDLNRMHDIIGEPLHEACSALLLVGPLAELRMMYELFRDEDWLPDAVHLRVLAEAKGKFQQLAFEPLVACIDEMFDDVVGLLCSRKVGVRVSAARVLHLSGKKEAIGPLEDALQQERSKNGKKAMQEAIDALSDAQESLNLGVYKRHEAVVPVEAQEQLRALLYEPGTMESWVRVCDLLNRSRGTEGLSLLLDYIDGHGLEHWSEDVRLLPWSWELDEQLKHLGKPSPAGWFWTPVSTFMLGEQEPFLDAATTALEKKGHSRKLPRALVPQLAEWIEKAWEWCESNQIPLDWLEVRLDGGSYKGAGRPTTSQISLWHHFGVVFAREPAFSGHTGKEGMRWVKINLPKGHAFRDLYPLRGGNRYMDLRDIEG